MKSYCFLFAFLVATLVNATLSYAQYSELSIGAGIANYWGDLNPTKVKGNLEQSGFGVSLGYHYHAGNGIALRGDIGYYRVANDDSFQEDLIKRQRNLSFKSPIVSGAVMAEFHLFELVSRYSFTRLISPYAVLGVGGFYFNPTTEYNGQTYELRPLGTEGQGQPGNPDIYKPVSLEIPFGGGLKFSVSESVAISVEAIMRYTLTDYLDDVSTDYASYESLLDENGSIAAALSERVDEFLGEPEGSQSSRFEGIQRGSPSVKDYYSGVMVRAQFYLGKGLQSPFNLGKGNSAVCPEF